MAKVGRIGEYVEGKEDFQCYTERLEQYFAANKVANDKRVAVFLAVVGAHTYSLLRDLITPDIPSTKTKVELKQTLKLHFRPKPLVIAERFKFHSRKQNDTETISDYLASLKRLSVDCDFGDFLNQALRDRFVCGLKNDVIQKKLLAETDLDFNKAVQIAQAMEMAYKNTSEIHVMAKPEVPIHHVKRGGRNSFKGGMQGQRSEKFEKTTPSKQKSGNCHDRKQCFRCGGKHSPDDCKFKNEKCYECQRVGHIGRKCKYKKKNVRYQGVDTDDDEDFGLFGLYEHTHHTQSTKTMGEEYRVTVRVDGYPINFELDTGAAATIVSESVYEEHLKRLPLQKPSIKLRDYGGGKVPIVGEIQVPVVYSEQSRILPLRIASGKKPALLGRDWLQYLKLDWAKIFSVKPITNSAINIKELLHKHDKLFEKGLGTIKNFQARIRVKPEAQSYLFKARPVPFALKEPLEKELTRLQNEGIISRVDQSDWATPIVVVPKSDKSIRLCCDFKVTINQCLEEQQYPLPNVEDMFAQLAGEQTFTKLDLSQAYQQLALDKMSERYLTINTHLGLFQFHRLPFGVSSAPAIFQSVMDQILACTL
ncbi:uncharacterized protein K02A2.6-like [Ylistrum balloti]|uniref:uncharacterized protein K02A2.6-like n=1 Tax=Ylistrum balloti TaxID=509963 RepID=UPI0029059500|nr:uncharacterized protein K02A2.6-like [Ylistrum balloti]